MLILFIVLTTSVNPETGVTTQRLSVSIISMYSIACTAEGWGGGGRSMHKIYD